MRTIELIDVEVSLPDDAIVNVRKHMAGQFFYGVVVGSDLLRDRIEVAAILRGFELRRTSAGSHLVRGDQGIDIIATNAAHVVIRVDDPGALPDARVHDRGIVVGPLSLDISAATILPGKERHAEGAEAWEAEWRLVGGGSAREQCHAIHRAMTARFPDAARIAAPHEERPGRWTLEATLPGMRVRIDVLDEGGGLRLDAIVFARPSP
jgi:hypothetical protein